MPETHVLSNLERGVDEVGVGDGVLLLRFFDRHDLFWSWLLVLRSLGLPRWRAFLRKRTLRVAAGLRHVGPDSVLLGPAEEAINVFLLGAEGLHLAWWTALLLHVLGHLLLHCLALALGLPCLGGLSRWSLHAGSSIRLHFLWLASSVYDHLITRWLWS